MQIIILSRENQNVILCKSEYHLVQIRILSCQNHNGICANYNIFSAIKNIIQIIILFYANYNIILCKLEY